MGKKGNVQSANGRIRRGERPTSNVHPARNATHSVAGGRSTTETLRHLYVHIPFCARICPYCAFYKERADPSQTQRFCEALLRELKTVASEFQSTRPRASPENMTALSRHVFDSAQTEVQLQLETIFFGGGTPTALTTAQLEFLLGG